MPPSDHSTPRKKGVRQLAALVPGCMGEALAAQGFAGSEIVMRWGEIVGPDLAHCSEPVRLQWPPRGSAADPSAPRQPAVLHVRVEGAFALEVQQQAAIIVERVNGYFGWRCVGQLRLKQGPVERRSVARRAEPVLSAADRARIAEVVVGVEDERLADALLRLGQAVARSKYIAK